MKHFADWYVMQCESGKIDYKELVHKRQDGRWVVAWWNDSSMQWQAPGYGGGWSLGNKLEHLSCPSYRHRSSAVRAAKKRMMD